MSNCAIGKIQRLKERNAVSEIILTHLLPSNYNIDDRSQPAVSTTDSFRKKDLSSYFRTLPDLLFDLGFGVRELRQLPKGCFTKERVQLIVETYVGVLRSREITLATLLNLRNEQCFALNIVSQRNAGSYDSVSSPHKYNVPELRLQGKLDYFSLTKHIGWGYKLKTTASSTITAKQLPLIASLDFIDVIKFGILNAYVQKKLLAVESIQQLTANQIIVLSSSDVIHKVLRSGHAAPQTLATFRNQADMLIAERDQRVKHAIENYDGISPYCETFNPVFTKLLEEHLVKSRILQHPIIQQYVEQHITNQAYLASLTLQQLKFLQDPEVVARISIGRLGWLRYGLKVIPLEFSLQDIVRYSEITLLYKKYASNQPDDSIRIHPADAYFSRRERRFTSHYPFEQDKIQTVSFVELLCEKLAKEPEYKRSLEAQMQLTVDEMLQLNSLPPEMQTPQVICERRFLKDVSLATTRDCINISLFIDRPIIPRTTPMLAARTALIAPQWGIPDDNLGTSVQCLPY